MHIALKDTVSSIKNLADPLYISFHWIEFLGEQKREIHQITLSHFHSKTFLS